MSFVEVTRGDSPLVLGLPHTGTEVPPDIWDELNQTGRILADTDWHIHKLYEGLVEGATSVRTKLHRYAIDVNRDPNGESLYPGQNTTTLVPFTSFDGVEIWHNRPDPREVGRRLDAFHAPYHEALAEELQRVKEAHGFVVLYDCHSIRSQIPFLFDGKLPDFNIGTDNGATCAPSIQMAVARACSDAVGFSSVQNGRFKGGWTTRHYGRPAEGMHAIQMELAQSTYILESPPWTYDTTKANVLRGHLQSILDDLIRWRPE